MINYEVNVDQVSIKIGMIINKCYFRYTIDSFVTLYKTFNLPIFCFRLIDYPDQRLEVHPNSIKDILQVEDVPVYYIVLEKRPSLSRKEPNREFWKSDIFDLGNEDPFMQLIYPHFIVIRLQFTSFPQQFLKTLNKMKLKIELGYYKDIKAEDLPISIVKLFWYLPWSTKYSIFVLLTNRKMTIDDITPENIIAFTTTPNTDKILEHIFSTNSIFSYELFIKLSKKDLPTEIIPNGHISVRKILVSPSAIVFLPHEVDLGNRVVRNLDPEIFLRLNFVDEYGERNIWSDCTSVLKKFKDFLKGQSILGRFYEFLGFSNSQMRNHSCWLVHSTNKINATSLRSTLGSFENCKSVCKYASRLGLCFSGTYKTVKISSDQIYKMEDVRNENYIFSDGVGLISPELLDEVLRSVYIKEKQIISALQVRICGCKGVLTLTPEISNKIYVRKSMDKFDSDHYELELCSYAVSRPGYLNRQIILVLKGLGIENEVFVKMQSSMINELKTTLVSESAAEANLRKTDSSYYKDLIFMLSNNIKMQDEPYLENMIKAVFLSSIKLIKSKARILAPQSSILMGVMDEYAVLEYGEVFLQISFENHSEIIEGKIAIGKNPCYHPGDIRVLKAVSRPNLLHLHNVIVFPQKGPRPHPNECSGSDLDGDLYFVTWNPELVPESHVEPMDYSSPGEKIEADPINIDKVIDFFGTFMESENIGRISNAHLIYADKYGVHSKQALHLSKLTSISVDYAKTGIPAIMPPDLRHTTWPDFMEKTGKESYESNGIIGILYRNCVLNSFEFNWDYKIDKRFLIKGYEEYIEFAKDLYAIYSSKIKKMMSQYDCENEYYLITAQYGEKSKKKMKYEENLQIQNLVETYKEEIHKKFREKTEKLLERRKIASACYFQVYSKPKTKKNRVICLSFPWIFYDYLI
jgi:RNA-dependent RNA polymerase